MEIFQKKHTAWWLSLALSSAHLVLGKFLPSFKKGITFLLEEKKSVPRQ